jgi:hypothetical protein
MVPIGAFAACDGSESSRNGCAYADGIPITKIKNVKKSNFFILHKTSQFII